MERNESLYKMHELLSPVGTLGAVSHRFVEAPVEHPRIYDVEPAQRVRPTIDLWARVAINNQDTPHAAVLNTLAHQPVREDENVARMDTEELAEQTGLSESVIKQVVEQVRPMVLFDRGSVVFPYPNEYNESVLAFGNGE